MSSYSRLQVCFHGQKEIHAIVLGEFNGMGEAVREFLRSPRMVGLETLAIVPSEVVDAIGEIFSQKMNVPYVGPGRFSGNTSKA